MQVHAYVTFNGNCREAMRFYQKCLGGKLTLQTVGESPLSEQMPEKMKDAILHATLTNDGFVLMGSDMCDEALQHGNSISLLLSCNSKRKLNSCYRKLSEGGIQEHPPGLSPGNQLTGDLRDKYGNKWVLHYCEAQARIVK
ncbi:MAG: glyoxalase [Bacteroidetes bacterium]|nr:glyoxalase [Bacteroidota bacterium]